MSFLVTKSFSDDDTLRIALILGINEIEEAQKGKIEKPLNCPNNNSNRKFFPIESRLTRT